jgi:hypothetical protein
MLLNVMKEIIAKLLEYRKRNTTILIILLVIVLLTLLFLNGAIPNPLAKKQNYQNNTELIEQASEALKNSKLEAIKVAPVNNISVKIATLVNDDGSGVIVGEKKELRHY